MPTLWRRGWIRCRRRRLRVRRGVVMPVTVRVGLVRVVLRRLVRGCGVLILWRRGWIRCRRRRLRVRRGVAMPVTVRAALRPVQHRMPTGTATPGARGHPNPAIRAVGRRAVVNPTGEALGMMDRVPIDRREKTRRVAIGRPRPTRGRELIRAKRRLEHHLSLQLPARPAPPLLRSLRPAVGIRM